MFRIGLIGFGYWGPNVAKNLHNNKEIDLVVICDKNAARLDKAKSIYIEQTFYELDSDKIINNPNIDAVALAVETSAHFKLAKQALEAGKHIYVEKPFTSTVKEAEELKSLADSKGLIIHVDHIMMYHPAIKRIKKMVDEGELGELMYFDASRMNLGQVKQDVSAMWDLAVHDLSIIDYFCNGINPDYISALGEKRYSIKETLTFLTFKIQGFVAHMKSSWISPLKERKFVLAGTKKMIEFDDMASTDKLIIYDKGFDFIDEHLEYETYAIKERSGDILIPAIQREDSLYNSIEHFRLCVNNNIESLSSPTQAIRILKILEEADRQMEKFNA